MTLSQATLILPAHMLPGGVAPSANDFGFEHVDKQRLECDGCVTLTQFTFHSPLGTVDKIERVRTFDKAAEHFIWHLAKGTPYQITKLFSNGSQTTNSFLYQNNKLTSQPHPLIELLTISQ